MDVDPAQSLNALIDRARAAMSQAPQGAAPGPFVGEAADGLISAEADAAGHIRSLRIDPKLARQPLEDTSAQIVLAVNAALDARPGRVDTGPLVEELKAVQEQSVQEMAKISRAFSDALARALER
ncbi:MAG TPA: YbaB/EbfC family nucleoid-associated protein [Jatrophihabitans sp.]|nr:YbaB/EbfC family nucleoid-associated protein [Jatrophihabitans sp.]